MTQRAILAQGLGKRFEHTMPRRRTLLGRLLGGAPPASIWALKDVSFEVSKGECFGIEGSNGAGKSTLLAIIAGILEPTCGRIEVNGRGNAFFHLSAGLQGELSVRDNIEICAILMGLRRRQALDRVEAILDFSGLGPYAEVRLAELSTGQAARVAFSTAMHADLDILLVDEALAVGDAAFQEKCRGAFESLRAQGKTLVVVSHDAALLKSVCSRTLKLEGGRLGGG